MNKPAALQFKAAPDASPSVSGSPMNPEWLLCGLMRTVNSLIRSQNHVGGIASFLALC